MKETKLSDTQLLNHYNNAYVTYCNAGGHTYARMNELKADEFRAQMVKRGIEVPQFDSNGNHPGVFNGPGSA